jgi:hypothetical protein
MNDGKRHIFLLVLAAAVIFWPKPSFAAACQCRKNNQSVIHPNATTQEACQEAARAPIQSDSRCSCDVAGERKLAPESARICTDSYIQTNYFLTDVQYSNQIQACYWQDVYTSCAWVESPPSGPENTTVPDLAGVDANGESGAGGAGSLIEPCALQNPESGSYCNDVNDLLSQLIRIARFLFGIIGSLALLFFVFGGMSMILSFGSAEKFKHGRDMMVAAVVGMVISFSAYIVINFVLTALGVTSEFRGL